MMDRSRDFRQGVETVVRGLAGPRAVDETRRSVSRVRSLLLTAYQRLGVTPIARVTRAQRLYLRAFEQSLRAGHHVDQVENAKGLRTRALTGVYTEAGKERPARPGASDPLERLMRNIRGHSMREDEDH
jgi:hypothetical protein